MAKPKKDRKDPKELLAMFETALEPLESGALALLTDHRTGAEFCECHIKGSKLIELGTIDVPLDPDEQAEFRANREVIEDAYAFQKMKDDARQRRTFSNIVTEYNKNFDKAHPIKIIGGQHRFEAIREALEDGVDELHGIKVYFGLDMEQRLDVQLISNTNIDTSSDLFDRMHETVAGPELRPAGDALQRCRFAQRPIGCWVHYSALPLRYLSACSSSATRAAACEAYRAPPRARIP